MGLSATSGDLAKANERWRVVTNGDPYEIGERVLTEVMGTVIAAEDGFVRVRIAACIVTVKEADVSRVRKEIENGGRDGDV